MRFFPPTHTAESVAIELIAGLENGTITLTGRDDAPGAAVALPKGTVPLTFTRALTITLLADKPVVRCDGPSLTTTATSS